MDIKWKRFFARFKMADGCWEWLASKNPKGYGKCRLGDKNYLAHRLSFSFFNGPIPEGDFVLHRCDNPSCVNPAHLFLGTAKDNSNDRDAKGRVAHGEAHVCAKLTEHDVADIRSKRGIVKQAELAAKYGVSLTVISFIMTGRTWRRTGGTAHAY